MVELGAALTAIRAAYDTAKTAKDVNDQAALNAAVSDIMERLTSAQFTLTELLQEHHSLIEENRQLREAQRKDARFDDYELFFTPLGFPYYVFKAEHIRYDKPGHNICPHCKELGRLSIMTNEKLRYRCLACKYQALHTKDDGKEHEEMMRKLGERLG